MRVEAAPINPSDLGLLVASADMSTATVAGTPERPTVTASMGTGALGGALCAARRIAARGQRGRGHRRGGGVVRCGASAPRPNGGIAGGAMYSQYRVVDAAACLVLPDGATAKDGASSFVNPLTALGMVETMRREGHSALVHTAAASNLGQMLVKICKQDGIPLVNVVRKPDQEELLRSLGAEYTSATRRRRRSNPI